MKITVRPACSEDLEILAEADRHVPREKMEKLVSDGFVLVAEHGKDESE